MTDAKIGRGTWIALLVAVALTLAAVASGAKAQSSPLTVGSIGPIDAAHTLASPSLSAHAGAPLVWGRDVGAGSIALAGMTLAQAQANRYPPLGYDPGEA